MQLRIACHLPMESSKQGEITMGLEDFFKRNNVTRDHAPGLLKMEMKIETLNHADGVILALTDALLTANGGKKFEPQVRLEPEIAMNPILV